MEAINNMMESRISRVNLDVTKNYTRVRIVNNNAVKEFVGRFVKTYRMGSGDGMTVHMEFNDNGLIKRVDEEMWGSVGGHELSYFIETPEKA